MPNILALAFISTFISAVVAHAKRPIKARYPDLDFFWLFYVVWFVNSALVGATGIDVLTDVLPDQPLITQIMTAIMAGGGSELFYKLYHSSVNPDTKALRSVDNASPIGVVA